MGADGGNGTSAGAAGTAGGPVIEIARFRVHPGSEEQFAADYLTVRHEIATTPGCRSVRMTRGVESPSTFVLLVEWDGIGAHLETFRGSERLTRWREAIGPHLVGPAAVEHVTDIDAGDGRAGIAKTEDEVK